MPEFLAETYAPRDAPGDTTPHAADIVLAAGQASEHRAPVRFLGAILVPDEETCFWLYQAPSADAVRAAMTRARLRPERITPAVPIRPPEARPS
jgi:Nickel responsive protein SCO4226-like